MLDMFISWLGDEFGDAVLEPIGDILKGIFENLLRLLFGWIEW